MDQLKLKAIHNLNYFAFRPMWKSSVLATEAASTLLICPLVKWKVKMTHHALHLVQETRHAEVEVGGGKYPLESVKLVKPLLHHSCMVRWFLEQRHFWWHAAECDANRALRPPHSSGCNMVTNAVFIFCLNLMQAVLLCPSKDVCKQS